MLLSVVLVLALLSGASAAHCELQSGALSGGARLDGLRREGGARSWLGVRYGVARRFERAVPVALPRGVHAMREVGARCPQGSLPIGLDSLPADVAEDCLFLNVHAPACADNLPVLVWCVAVAVVAVAATTATATATASHAARTRRRR